MHKSPYICMSADPRSSKQYQSFRIEIISTQNSYQCSSNNVPRMWSQCMRGRFLLLCTRDLLHSLQDNFYKSKTRFPKFDASNAWQMGHNSREGFFLGQELLLDFPAWLDLTSNADNTITVYQLPSKFQNTFWFLKMCWWLTGLSRLNDASQPPGRHIRYFKTMLKILADSSNATHFCFVQWYFGLALDRFTCCVHVTITRVNNLFPDFRRDMLFFFDSQTAKFLCNTL